MSDPLKRGRSNGDNTRKNTTSLKKYRGKRGKRHQLKAHGSTSEPAWATMWTGTGEAYEQLNKTTWMEGWPGLFLVAIMSGFTALIVFRLSDGAN